jgi:hypothetical protein
VAKSLTKQNPSSNDGLEEVYEGKGRDFCTTLMGHPKITLDGPFSTQTTSRISATGVGWLVQPPSPLLFLTEN